ncbi:MAG: FAD-binding oxidoreductase, partial [Bacteroidota bacterium]
IIEELTAQLGKEKVLKGDALSDRYTHVWKMDIPLQAKAVLLPSSTADVSAIMNICHDHKQKVVVHGGLTNLVGGTESTDKDIVISMEKMTAIEEIDALSRTISVQAGVILENIHQAVSEKGLMFPLTFGAKGSAQVGGMISSNAGGLQVFRYGMTRDLVLGLEVVLADGTVISSMKKLIKNNSGYDLKQLFIGAEGTLGIITKAIFRLREAPISRNAAFVALSSYEKVTRLLRYMDAGLAGTLSGFELMWEETYQQMTHNTDILPPPIPYGFPFYVLLESQGSAPKQDQERLEELLEACMEKGWIEEAAFANSPSELTWFWGIRENVDALVSSVTIDQHYDISIPTGDIGEYVNQVRPLVQKLDGVEEVYAFGHVADGNIHFLVGKAHHDPNLTQKINAIIYERVGEMNGSISAEHGVGEDKKAYLSLCRSEAEIQLMKTLKQSMDPHNLLNRGKILDME